jgi:hypothetical protein
MMDEACNGIIAHYAPQAQIKTANS